MYISSGPVRASDLPFGASFFSYLDAEIPVSYTHLDVYKRQLLNIQEIKGLLPHRYPMLLVDKVIEIGPEHIVGVKCVTNNAVSYTHLDVYKRQGFGHRSGAGRGSSVGALCIAGGGWHHPLLGYVS